MTWSVNSDSNYVFTSQETDSNGVTLTVTEIFSTDFEPISTAWSDGTNSGSIGEVVEEVTFAFDGTNSETQTVIKETGTKTWTWQDGSTTVTETVNFISYYSNDGNRTYMGGTESQDGIDTVYYGDSGVQKVASTAYSTSGAPAIDASSEFSPQLPRQRGITHHPL